MSETSMVELYQEMRPPMHYTEGTFTPWHRWFAWRPVRLSEGGWAWMRRTWRRHWWPAPWFSAFYGRLSEHSDWQAGDYEGWAWKGRMVPALSPEAKSPSE